MHPIHPAFEYMVHFGTRSPKRLVYLVHLDPAYKHAQHYMGSTDNLERRMSEHGGPLGARLLQVQCEAGGSWHLVRTWQGGRRKERQLKNNNGKRYCPECTEHPLPGISARPTRKAVQKDPYASLEMREGTYDEIQAILSRNITPISSEALAALDDVVSTLVAGWRQQASTGEYGAYAAGGYR